jgi:hypothetical protein
MTKKWQKGNTRHSVVDTGQASVPREDLGINNKENSVVQGNKQELPSLSCETQEHNHQCHCRDDCQFVPRWTSCNWRNITRHLPIRDWNKVHLLGSSDGHVPLRSTNFLDHANWKMVKHSVPQIHKETSTGVYLKMIKVQLFKHIQNKTETNPMKNIVGNSFLLLMR